MRSDEPRTYEDGCHLDFATITPGTCAYGATSSKTTIVLFGDSHAAQWFPALERLAVSRGYRLLSFTKSACPAVDVSVYNSDLKRTYTECDAWRAGVLTRIVSEGPALVIISDSRGHVVVSGGKQVDAATDTALWKAGLARTIREVKPSGAQVVVIGDTPRSSFDVPVCVSSHMQNWLGCSTPAADAVDTDWLAVEQATATKAGASFVDPTAWVCPSDPCPAVIGRYLVYRDTHHMTTPFAASLAPMLEAALPPFTH